MCFGRGFIFSICVMFCWTSLPLTWACIGREGGGGTRAEVALVTHLKTINISKLPCVALDSLGILETTQYSRHVTLSSFISPIDSLTNCFHTRACYNACYVKEFDKIYRTTPIIRIPGDQFNRFELRGFRIRGNYI